MAKGKKGRSFKSGNAEDYGLDEVDSFHAAQEKVLLDEGSSATIGNRRSRNDDDDSDVGVMDIDSASGSEDEEIEQDEEDDDDAEFFGKKDELEEEEEDDGAWGSRKGNYYGADDLEDEESAKQIEEEALRQQKKHLQELNMDDYIDEEVEQEWSRSAKVHDYGDVLDNTKEEATSFSDITKLDSKSRKKYIISAHPEFIPLTKELTKLNPILEDLREVQNKNEVLNVKFTALSSYLGAITSYLSIFLAFSKEDEAFTMKEHPVMESILSSKELWRQASTLEEVDEEDDDDDESEDEDQSLEGDSTSQGDFKSASESIDELSESDSEVENEEEDENSDLEIDISKPRVFIKARQTNYDDLIEGEIAEVDAEEKKSRKKTLRFYTSKINQQDKKKDEKYTGDLDIPYKERLFERQQRLIEEARKRGLHDDNGDDLDGEASFDEQDQKDAKFVNEEFDDSYYQTIKSSKLAVRADRQQAHVDAVKAAKEGKLADLKEEVGEAGKRAITYQILKNKGLTAHKKKTDRNSRVKKRKKYEKAQKKLKSVRAVYSAPTSAYDGEKTGIKKNLSKSVKFGN